MPTFQYVSVQRTRYWNLKAVSDKCHSPITIKIDAKK